MAIYLLGIGAYFVWLVFRPMISEAHIYIGVGLVAIALPLTIYNRRLENKAKRADKTRQDRSLLG